MVNLDIYRIVKKYQQLLSISDNKIDTTNLIPILIDDMKNILIDTIGIEKYSELNNYFKNKSVVIIGPAYYLEEVENVGDTVDTFDIKCVVGTINKTKSKIYGKKKIDILFNLFTDLWTFEGDILYNKQHKIDEEIDFKYIFKYGDFVNIFNVKNIKTSKEEPINNISVVNSNFIGQLIDCFSKSLPENIINKNKIIYNGNVVIPKLGHTSGIVSLLMILLFDIKKVSIIGFDFYLNDMIHNLEYMDITKKVILNIKDRNYNLYKQCQKYDNNFNSRRHNAYSIFGLKLYKDLQEHFNDKIIFDDILLGIISKYINF